MKLFFTLLLSVFYVINPATGNFQKKKNKEASNTSIEDKYPTPPDNPNRLFYVQRDPNINTIMYDLNLDKNGRPDAETPIHAYWIRYAEKGEKDELNYLQRKFAYGLVTKKINDEQFDVRFVSYKKLPLTLKKANDDKYHVFINADQKQIMLNRIFVKIEGGTLMLPNVVYVELKGVDAATGKEIMHRFKP
ncbi:DUF4833 domain-containing protein [Mucilaginibacter auburnensis]|uniref:Uncharacterized protein DUF4833 n=1 Tax=Mucilaginibacter auburnensis TaxID=1457233 RepID=A0A2H9VV88_9SPHI|nr:DUF4833 domain-containing protein [Mucilaginibacter auburnensis]PJJ84736.1 uncharacterized protein DUF4833 [Mucilaginibacter auburnensis]